VAWEYITVKRPVSVWPTVEEFMDDKWEDYSFWATVDEITCDSCGKQLVGIDAVAEAIDSDWLRVYTAAELATDHSDAGVRDMCPTCRRDFVLWRLQTAGDS
jgi:hypothetical protein